MPKLKHELPPEKYDLWNELSLELIKPPIIPSLNLVSVVAGGIDLDQYVGNFARYKTDCEQKNIIPFSKIQLSFYNDHFKFKKNESFFDHRIEELPINISHISRIGGKVNELIYTNCSNPKHAYAYFMKEFEKLKSDGYVLKDGELWFASVMNYLRPDRGRKMDTGICFSKGSSTSSSEIELIIGKEINANDSDKVSAWFKELTTKYLLQ